jgi:ubiquinone/menaquinone biosynthesis C-methylase UbiE
MCNPSGRNLEIDLSEDVLRVARKRVKKLQGANYTLNKGTAFCLDISIQNEIIDS